MNGLIVEVYKPSYGSCSNGGASSDRSTLILLGAAGPFGAEPGATVKIVPNCGGVKAVECDADGNVITHPGMIGPMFGGCFIYSSDSRFPERYPVPLHDRWETQETYDAMSR